MIAAAQAAIVAAADDAAALSIDERTRLIGEAERDALAVAREEVALIKAANAAGKTILFRPDTDPLALLELEIVEQQCIDEPPVVVATPSGQQGYPIARPSVRKL